MYNKYNKTNKGAVGCAAYRPSQREAISLYLGRLSNITSGPLTKSMEDLNYATQ